MVKNLIIRFAKPNEEEKIVNLYKKEASLEKIEKIRKDVKKDFQSMAAGKRIILFAEIKNKVIGTVQIVFELPNKILADGKNFAHLHHLRIEESFRNQGIGKKLEEEVIKIAKKRGFKTITLSVEHDQSYKFLKTLYQKWGYSVWKKDPKNNETHFLKKI